MKTDPENRDYDVILGCTRKTKEWDVEKNNGTKLLEEGEQLGIDNDPFKRLQHVKKDKEVAKAKEPMLQQLMNLSDEINKDSYELNSKLRKKFREEKQKNNKFIRRIRK